VALNPESRRTEGVRPLSAADLAGSRGKDGKGVNLPTSTYENPGPTPNMRGIEANTEREGSTEPAFTTQTFGSEVPRGEVFDTPDSSNRLSGGSGEGSAWDSPDSSKRNSHPLILLPDSFTEIGESYPANGGMDGES
jgi:hypothetical protein